MLYYKIFIDVKKCDGCGRCVEVCPAHVLRVQDGKAVLRGDPDECMGCEFCVEACPLSCIGVMLRTEQPDEVLPRRA